MGNNYVRKSRNYRVNCRGNYYISLKRNVQMNRDKEKKILAESFLYGVVAIGLAWILMFIIIGFDFLIDKL